MNFRDNLIIGACISATLILFVFQGIAAYHCWPDTLMYGNRTAWAYVTGMCD